MTCRTSPPRDVDEGTLRMESSASSAELVSLAVQGEPRATDQLLRYLRPLVVKYCRARVGRSATTADDVAQEVCLAVLTALPKYREQGRPFLAFVYGIAAHKVADAHRALARNRAEPVAEVPDQAVRGVGPEDFVLQDELNGALGRLLHLLPAKQREILVLRVVVGLSAEETAEAVGSTPGAVRVAQHRALGRLRKEIASMAVPIG
ncbi:sigma-70 family RNA polymerase sigma factor [Lentzea albidocapillata]